MVRRLLSKLSFKGRRKRRNEREKSLTIDSLDKKSLVHEIRTDSASLLSRSEPCKDEVVKVDPADTNATKSTHRQLFGELFPGGTSGINILYTPSGTTSTLVDIVLIHGLKGHPFTTWLDAQSGTYWPFHLLRQDVPNARIMTFGYDSDPVKILMSAGQNTLRNHANTLLADLVHARTADPDRKLVFIVHSLGGLVTKKALCMSESSSEPDLNQIDRCAVAVAFLGTPHRGSGLATFAKGATDILKFVHKRVNSDILEPLKRDSQVLADVEDSFAHWLRRKGNQFNITCFYEELGLVGVGLVVTKESAHINGYPQLPIHSTHRDMTKFTSLDDVGYRRVIGEIERWLEKLEAQPDLSRVEKDCLQSLSFKEMNDRSIDINPAAEGTCAWILNKKAYQSWFSQGRNLLWIKGKPGVGKSTLIKYVLESLKMHESLASTKVMTLSFFFHGRGAEIERTPLGLFRSLLFQLLERFPGPLSGIVATFKDRHDKQGQSGEKWNWRPLELQTFLETSLPKILEVYAIRIVVDALDECGEKAARELVRFFQRLRSKCSTAKNDLTICFSCRHFPLQSLEDGFEICVEDENHADIKAYIRSELQDAIDEDEELEVLQDEILVRSNYVFQWVHLVLDRAVSQHNEGCSLLYIQQKLRDTPTELHSLYEDTLQSLSNSKDKRSQSLQLVQWICFATRPLSLTELRIAMIGDWNTSYESQKEYQHSPHFVNDDTKMEKRVKGLSGGLAEIKMHGGTGVVQFIHQSVSDYLTEGGLKVLDTTQESVDESIGRAHFRLARSCIRYFSMTEFHQRKIRLEFPTAGVIWRPEDREKAKALEDEFPFLQYSIGSWHHHVQVAEKKKIPQEDLLGYWNWPSPRIMLDWLTTCGWAGVLPFGRPCPGSTFLHAASLYGLTSTVKAILDSTACDDSVATSGDELKRTPLYYAACGGHDGVVGLLLKLKDLDPDQKDVEGQTPLLMAAEGGHENVAKLLINTGEVDINSEDRYGMTPLSQAANHGWENVVKLLMRREGVDIYHKDRYGRSALSWAAKCGNENITKLLMEHNPIALKSQDNMALPYAANGGHDQVVKLLLEHTNADTDFKALNGKTALSCAAEGGHENVVELLLRDRGINPNFKDDYGMTALSSAISEGYEDVAKLLLEGCSDIDVSVKNVEGMTALSWAAKHGYENITRLLLERSNFDPGSEDDDGRTPLTWAAKMGRVGVVELLLGCSGADVNTKVKHGKSLLSWAARYGWEGVMRILLESDDIEINVKDDDGMTALSWASKKGHNNMAKLLLKRDEIDVHSKDDDGMTALAWASKKGHDNLVDLLLKCGNINIYLRDESGMTPLTWASRRGHGNAVELLLYRCGGSNHPDGSEMTALAWASREGHTDLLKALLKRGDIDINFKDMYGMAPLSWALVKGHEGIVELLLKRDDIDINSQDGSGRTPLSFAFSTGNRDVMKSLLARDDINIHSRDGFGKTPLLWASAGGYEDAVKSLLERDGIDIHSKDDKGMSALAWASREEHEQVTELLKSHGAT